MEILIESKMLSHEGGTKFYEVSQFYNVANKHFVAVYRWGKVTVRNNGGGETKIERFFDIRKCQDAARIKIQEKTKRGYKDSWAGSSMPTKADDDTIRLTVLTSHYKDNDTVNGIMHGLGLEDVLTVAAGEEALDDIVSEGHEPEPEIIRGEDWASW